MLSRTLALFLLSIPAVAQASYGDWQREDPMFHPRHPQTNVEDVDDLLELLRSDQRHTQARNAMSEFLSGLGTEASSQVMDEIRNADLLYALTDTIVYTQDRGEVADALYSAAMRLLSSGEHDDLVATLASTPLNTYSPNEPGHSGLHSYAPDVFGGSLEFNEERIHYPGELMNSLARELRVAEQCRNNSGSSEVCTPTRSQERLAQHPSNANVTGENEGARTWELIDAHDDDYDQDVLVETTPNETEDDSNAYSNHFNWGPGRSKVTFDTPWKSSTPEIFQKKGEVVFKGRDGWQRVTSEENDGEDTDEAPKSKKPWVPSNVEVTLWGDYRRTGDSVLHYGNDNTYLNFLGYEATLFSGVTTNGRNVKANVDTGVRAYLARARLYESQTLVEWEDGSLAVKEYGEANLGTKLGAGASATVGLSGVSLDGKVTAFAGADATGWVGIGASLCDIRVDTRGKASVSAGIGAEANGTIKMDWSQGQFGLGGGLGATFGPGMGTGAEIWIDAQQIVKDPKKVASCLGDKAETAALFMAEPQIRNAELQRESSDALLQATKQSFNWSQDKAEDLWDWSSGHATDAASWSRNRASDATEKSREGLGSALDWGFQRVENTVNSRVATNVVSSFKSFFGIRNSQGDCK
ncbi:MAG: hypothetical protein VX519_05285 [Myxococcota bacterium]|nr:hypothetical protein [Myxococcota bacterium]